MKVIVADDEYFSRKALVKMLEKMDLPITICGECENGREVISLLQQEPVDLIVTDIKMPEIDGLKLAQHVKEEGYHTDIIIETGYADFDYARTAIHYGVREYIMKPINERELYTSVQLVMEEQARKNRKSGMQMLDFSSVLQNSQLCGQIFEWRPELLEEPYCMFLVNGKARANQGPDLKEWLIQYGEFQEVLHFYFAGKNETILLAFCQEEWDLSQKLEGTARLELEQGLSGQCWVSASLWHTGLEDLKQAYRECIYAINERILSSRQLLFYQPQMELTEILTAEQEHRLTIAAEQGAEEAASEVIWEFFAQARETGHSIYSFFAALMRIFFVLNRVYYRCGKEEISQNSSGGRLLFDFQIDLYQFYSLEEVRQYTEMLLREVCAQSTKEDNFSIAQNLVDYLERHYAEEISLGDLAKQRYFVSISSLSRLFKAYTGQTFAKYLTQLRLEKAKTFLECSQMTISEIAACTGYYDPSHFSQMFRKVYGLSPRDYRKPFLPD